MLIFTAVVLTTLIFIYSAGQKQRIITDAATEMEAIARLKADQIAHWRNEKLNDARLIHENVTLVEHIDAMFIKERNKWEKSRLTQLLNTLIENYDFHGAVLLDAGGGIGTGRSGVRGSHGRFPPVTNYNRDIQS